MTAVPPDRRRSIIAEDNPFGHGRGRDASPLWHNIMLDYSLLDRLPAPARRLLVYILARMKSDYSITLRTRSPSLKRCSASTERTLRRAIRELESQEVLSPRKTPDVFWVNPEIIARRKIFV